MTHPLSRARHQRPHFPMLGVDGYAGEQDGNTAVLSDVYTAASLMDAVKIPEWARVHWADYTPGLGWEYVLGAWRSDIPDDADWPQE